MFKRIVKFLPAVCLATGMAWAAESPFIGEWKLDPSKSRMPDEMKVTSEGGNKYVFDFGVGVVEPIVVDGTDQPGLGGTLLSVSAEAPDTWIVQRKKDGRLQLKATWKLSKDGSTLTDYFRGFESDGSTLSVDYLYQRTGGGLGFAGDWRSIKETMNSPFMIQVKEYQGDGLSIIMPSENKTRNMKFDGKDYPNEGPGANRGASSSIQRVDERTFMITDKTNGKVTDTEAIGLSADLKTLTITVNVPGHDKPNVMVFDRSLVAAGAARADDAAPTPGQAWRMLTRIDVDAGYQFLEDSHPGAVPEARDPEFVSALEAGHKRALERADVVTSYEGYVATLGEFARSVGDGHVWSNARFLPRTVRWAGIVATKRGPDWVVASNDAKVAGADLVGAKIVSCDGVPADALARDVLHYRTVVSVDALQVVNGGWLLIDEGNPFLHQPNACDFDQGGKRTTLTLNWNSIGRSDLLDHHWYQPYGHAGFDLRRSGRGYWIAMQELRPEAQKVIDQANANATEIRAAPYVVVDVRGNGGGRDGYARDLADAIYGAPYVEARLGPKDAAGGGCEEVYRATAGNIVSVSAAADNFAKGGDATAAAGYTRAVAAMKAAQAAGHALTGPAFCKPKAHSASHGGASLIPGKVYLLTDAGCFSSCIRAAEFFTKLGATQIGQTTGADTHYSQVYQINLPSGMATFSTLRAIMTDAPKAIGPYVPEIRYEGDIADTAALEKWVGEIAMRS